MINSIKKVFFGKPKTVCQEFKELDTAGDKNICAVVDPNNIDSLMAFAKLYSNGFVNTAISYNKQKDPTTCVKIHQYVILGTHVSSKHWNEIFSQAEKITIFAYHGTYEDETTTTNPKVVIVRPPSFDTVDNSVCAMLNIICERQMRPSYYDDLMMPAAAYINGMRTVSGYQGKQIDIKTKSKLLATYQYLRETLNAGKLIDVPSYYPKDDVSGYMLKNRAIRKDINDNMVMRYYGDGRQFITILTMNVPDYNFGETLDNVLMSRGSFIGYHDTRYSRIYRLFTTNPKEVQLVVKTIKPTNRWMEGTIHCLEAPINH